MTEFTGGGDPKRTLELLWGRTAEPRRGPKPGLDVASVVAAAIEIADTEGLGAVSMRSVAKRLGRSPMSLYTYVPSKAELLDLMLDAAMGHLPSDPLDEPDWRAAIERWAADQWALYQRHPWLLSISGARSALGPNTMIAYERLVALLDRIGLSGLEVHRLGSALSTYVAGSARAVADARLAALVTGISDDDWWAERAPLLEEVSESAGWAERFPVTCRLDAEQVFDQPDRAPADDTPYLEEEALAAFRFGLRSMLDGIAGLVSPR